MDALIGKGLLWFGGGLALTVFTRLSASDGGTYVIAYGPMVYGAFCLIGGVFNKLRG